MGLETSATKAATATVLHRPPLVISARSVGQKLCL
jgi:hypothetical protein